MFFLCIIEFVIIKGVFFEMNEQVFRYEQLERIKKLLYKKGYTEDMIFQEFRGKTNFQYDLCVIELDTQKVLFVFEFKESKFLSLGRMKPQIGQISGQPEIDVNTMIFFITLLKSNSVSDNVVDKEQHTLIGVNLEDILPTYRELRLKREISYKSEIQDSKEKILKSVRELKRASIFLSLFLVVFLFLDIFEVVNITNNRLILMGIIVATLIIPYFNTIRIGDLFEIKQK